MVTKADNTRTKLNIFEVLVFLAILLVTVFTFFEDYAILTGMSIEIQTILMLIGFGFDFFFTVEFLARLYYARFDKGVSHYLVHGYGWVDFLASVPLVMFNSGPHAVAFVMYATGVVDLEISATFLTLLKLIKIIRIARVLRLLRILKIFKMIKYTDSNMAQRHISKIITIGVSITVLVLFASTIALEYTDLRRSYDPSYSNKVTTFESIKKKLSSQKELAASLKSLDALHNVILVTNNKKIVYSRTSPAADIATIPIHDYAVMSGNGLDVFFDTRQENDAFAKNMAKDFLIFYFIILFLIIGYLVFYSPHFALTITDPIKIIKRGISDRDYNLEVIVPELYESDEVYELANEYNEQFLPMKDRARESRNEKINLLDDDADDA